MFRNVLHKLKFFRESKFRDNLNQGYFDLKFMIVRDEIIWGCFKRQDENR